MTVNKARAALVTKQTLITNYAPGYWVNGEVIYWLTVKFAKAAIRN